MRQAGVSVCIFIYMNLHKTRIDISPQSQIQNYQTLKNMWDWIQHRLRAMMALIVYQGGYFILHRVL